jgi:hypothetical protein
MSQKYPLYLLMVAGIILYVLRDTLQTALGKYVGIVDFGALGALTFGVGLILLLLRKGE